MDRLESLGNALSQITMYDIKSMYNQVRKDRYAPVRDHSCPLPGEECGVQCQRDGSESPGCDQRRTMVRAVALGRAKRMLKSSRGASSTLMQEIAQGYVNYASPRLRMLTSLRPPFQHLQLVSQQHVPRAGQVTQ